MKIAAITVFISWLKMKVIKIVAIIITIDSILNPRIFGIATELNKYVNIHIIVKIAISSSPRFNINLKSGNPSDEYYLDYFPIH